MMRVLFLLSSIFSFLTAFSQLTIIEQNGSSDISNTTITVTGSNNDTDIEHGVWVINSSNEELVVGLKRIEEMYTPGTASNLCWLICPADPVNCGDFPTWTSPFTETIAPGDTVFSFAFHLHPNHNMGCGQFRFDFFDNSNQNVIGSFSILVDHGSPNGCTTGLGSEQSFLPEVTVYPSPSDMDLFVTSESESEIKQLHLLDITGREVPVNYSSNQRNNFVLETGQFINGVYFLAIEFENQKRLVKKIQIIH